MDRLLVIGHHGMLGTDLCARAGCAGVDLPACDITDPASIAATLDEHRPSCVINCAAYTAVDQAESDEAAATKLNVDGVAHLARATAERDIQLIALSTDYVFAGTGDTPYDEDAPRAPQSVYGRTKAAGEAQLEALGGTWSIARTQWLYGAHGNNFVDTIARLSAERETLQVVNDQVGAPTWTWDLVDMLLALAQHRATGRFHTVNSGYASWYEVACHIVAQLGRSCTVEPCSTDAFPRPAPRPHNSRLALTRLTRLLGHTPRPWHEALTAYLQQRYEA